MSENIDLSLERVLDLLAEKLASKLSLHSGVMSPRLITIEQAALYLGRTSESMRHMVSSGEMSAVLMGRLILLDRQDLDDWIKDNKIGWA